MFYLEKLYKDIELEINEKSLTCNIQKFDDFVSEYLYQEKEKKIERLELIMNNMRHNKCLNNSIFYSSHCLVKMIKFFFRKVFGFYFNPLMHFNRSVYEVLTMVQTVYSEQEQQIIKLNYEINQLKKTLM